MVIMVVDDERVAREGICDLLSDIVPGSEVHSFDNSEDAMNATKTTAFDVALLDIMMEPFDGIQMAELLVERFPRLNIIFTTGFDGFTKEAMELHASGYITKPITKKKLEREMNLLRFPVENTKKEAPLRAHCFGNFDFYIHGKSPSFSYSKSKELLAYLIDRQGTVCTNGEIASVLGDDESGDVLGYSYLNGIRRDLAKVFEEAGFPDILIRTRGGMRLDTSHIACDYYDLLEGKEGAAGAYNGEYMTQYSWAELTNGELWKKYGD